MSASAFTPVGSDGGPLDSTKSVRYTEGMVLGVDDFQQEHVYLAGLARDALRLGAGAGTVLGLKASVVKVAGAGPGGTDKYEVHVGPGRAVDWHGRMIRVSEEQCADIGAWVAAQPPDTIKNNLTPSGGTLNGTLPLWVMASYTNVATDAVPVPGEPCRSDDQLVAASRWTDDFQLAFSLAAPAASRLKQAMWQYFVWTKYALVPGAVPSPGTPADLNTMLDGVIALLGNCRSAAAAGRFLPPTLPAGQTAVTINKDDVELQMRCLDAANAGLVADLLPDWLDAAPAPAPGAPDGILLAELSVAVKRTAPTDLWGLDPATPPTASSRSRPVALSGPTLRVGPRVP